MEQRWAAIGHHASSGLGDQSQANVLSRWARGHPGDQEPLSAAQFPRVPYTCRSPSWPAACLSLRDQEGGVGFERRSRPSWVGGFESGASEDMCAVLLLTLHPAPPPSRGKCLQREGGDGYKYSLSGCQPLPQPRFQVPGRAPVRVSSHPVVLGQGCPRAGPPPRGPPAFLLLVSVTCHC